MNKIKRYVNMSALLLALTLAFAPAELNAKPQKAKTTLTAPAKKQTKSKPTVAKKTPAKAKTTKAKATAKPVAKTAKAKVATKPKAKVTTKADADKSCY